MRIPFPNLPRNAARRFFTIGILGLCAVLLTSASYGEAASTLLADGGKSDYRIVVAAQAPPSTRYAAEELSRFIERISGARLIIIDDAAPAGDHEILVGASRRLADLGLGLDLASLGRDGYILRTTGARLAIAGGEPRGTLYGVYGLLEDHFGCRWFTPEVERIPKKVRLPLPQLNERKVPVFENRETYLWESFDGNWMARNRLNGTGGRGRLAEKQGLYPPMPALEIRHGGGIRFGFGFFVHTMDKLVPPAIFFAAHPEYYALHKGKRVPGQLCCTNEEVIRICTAVVLSGMLQQPEATVFDVSQNDNQQYCQCKNCQKLAKAEGSQMGPLLHLVNCVADAAAKKFPDKIVETLAYQYTRHAPAKMRPRPNVVIRLCDIECCFAHPLASGCSPRNSAFVNDLKDWAKVCDRLWVWDYITNFGGYLLPMPNTQVFADNIRLFAANHVTGVFEQGTYDTADGEFSALDTYMLAKLMWDPTLDGNAVRDEFLAAYYGPAAATVRQYIELLGGTVADRKIHVGEAFGAAAPHLTPKFLTRANALWEQAEVKAASDPAALDRVRRSRMSVDYAIVEQSRLLARMAAKKPTREQQSLLALARQRFAPFTQTMAASKLTRVREWQDIDKTQYRDKLAADLGIGKK